MIFPEGDAIKKNVNNRYALVVLAAKRAKQLKDGAPSLIDTDSTNALTIALEEIAARKVTIGPAPIVGLDDDVAGIAIESTAAESSAGSFSTSNITAVSPELAAFMPKDDEPTASDDAIDVSEDNPTLEKAKV